MAQLHKRLGLYLPGPLTGEAELASHLFQGASTTVFETEPKLKNPSLTPAQAVMPTKASYNSVMTEAEGPAEQGQT